MMILYKENNGILMNKLIIKVKAKAKIVKEMNIIKEIRIRKIRILNQVY
jgi:hypothetical protein